MDKKKITSYRIVVLILAIAVVAQSIALIRGRSEPPRETADGYDYEYDTELSEKFEGALADGDIEVWFQPIMDAQTGSIFGAEALSRWKMDGEYISPSVFVSVLEETGQVSELDRNVFRKACEYQKQRLEDGKELFPISVNMSVVSVMQENVVDDYTDIFSEYALPQGCISIEVTETLDTDKNTVAAVVDGFRKAGFKLEIDDFGAGYASYANLSLLEYDVLKVDKSIIDGIGNERGEVLLKEILRLADELGMETIAEGVETEDQVEFLRENGCSAIQGYYYSKALPQEDFISFVDGL